MEMVEENHIKNDGHKNSAIHKSFQISYNYISSVITTNMLLQIFIVILLITLSLLISLIAVKAKRFLQKLVAEGVVIDDVRPFSLDNGPSRTTPLPSPPLKPKRSAYNERLV